MQSHRAAAVFVFGMNARRIGGIEVHTRELVARLAALDCQVVLCYIQPPSPAVRQYLSFPNVIWEELPGADQKSWRATWGLFLILRRHHPRLMHLQFTPWPSLAAWVARLNGVRKIFFTDHNSHPEGFEPSRERPWIRLAAWLVHLPVSTTVAVSDFNLQIIATKGTFPLYRVRRIHNGVDLERSHDVAAAIGFRTRYAIPPERILITQISQVIPEKGIGDVLAAAKLALARHPGLHFAFIGDGKHLAHFTTRAIELGIAAHVTWTGMIIDPVAEGVFMATDISCLAARWQEAFGLVLAEAMSCGKPVVATRVGAIPEVVEDGKTGFLVPHRDPAALADKFILLARDSELRAALGRAGRERAATHFDVRTNVNRLLEVYGDF
jgi:glycosyltransferase involved in cell wall biosynthesis